MLMKIFLIFTLLCSTLLAEDLEFKNIYFLDKNLEISGLTTYKDNLIFISDNKEDQYIYQLKLKDSKTYLTDTFLKINTIKNFQEYYYSTLLSNKGGRWLKSPWDLEGIALCGDTMYLANEQVREILSIDLNKKSLNVIPFNFQAAFAELGKAMEDIPTNAGFEGVTVDCETQTLYIAQERNPRGIFVYNLKNNQYLGLIRTIEAKTNQVSPDYSDLFFYKKHLYVIERNEWKVLKINPSTKKVVTEYSFENNPVLNLRKLYKTDEPYGLAEALFINDEEVIIGIDNNNKPLSKRAEILFNFRGTSSSLIHFKKPKSM